jgi:steroid delta-isomerase-like uncharacterized protein
MDRWEELREAIRQFVHERGWEPFHDPKNLAMAVASEAGELAGELRWVASSEADAWCRDARHRTGVRDEIADVGITLLMLCDRVGLDPVEAMHHKLRRNAQKYPPEPEGDRPEPNRGQPSREPTDPAAVAREWMRTWESGDLAHIRATHDAAFVDRASAGRDATTEGFEAGVRALYAAFPDFRARVEDLLVDAARERVTVRWTAQGTHRGTFLGAAPTHRTIEFAGIEMVTVRNGRITERWGEWDGLSLLQQLGLLDRGAMHT